ncbi:MAG: sortase [Solirubrobacterales bacterium]
MRRILRIFGVAMITAGSVILIDAGLTLAWKEPVSSIYGAIQQDQAAQELEELEGDFAAQIDPERIDEGASLEKQAAQLARQFARQAPKGEGIGRVMIPSIGVDYVFLNGTDTATLQRGPGRYEDTAFPGQGRTIGIAGHRTTYLAPFRKINDVADGDEIVVEMPYGTFTYEVERSEIVKPTDVEIVDDIGSELLVLTACHPLYSAKERYATFARLTDIELGPARSQPD